MIIGSNINTLMQQIMALKSPELIAILPEVEKLAFEDRVAVVRRGHANLSSVIKNWDKFAGILEAQRSLSKSEIKKKAKNLKNVRSKLEMALRLADPKIIPALYRSKAEAAFNVVAAWFLLNQDYMEEVYARRSLSRQDIGNLNIAPTSTGLDEPVAEADVLSRNEYSDGPSNASSASDHSEVDLMDKAGLSLVY